MGSKDRATSHIRNNEPNQVFLLFLSLALMTGCLGVDDDDGSSTCYGDDCSSSGLDGGIIGEDGGQVTLPSLDLAGGVDIDRVVLYQGVEIQLMEDGVASAEGAPIVPGRNGLVRAFVSPLDDWEERAVVARLTLEYDELPTVVLESELTFSEASEESDPSSTFNFYLNAEHITETAVWTVSVHEVEEQATIGALGRALWPEEAGQAFDASAVNTVLKLFLLPLQYDADGSGRLPDTSEGQLAIFENALMANYPVSEVLITVMDPLPYSGSIDAMGAGWNEALNAVTQQRRDQGIPGDTYLMGLVSPANDYNEFCRMGCVAGLSSVPWDPRDDSVFAGLSVGFPGQETADTVNHELGHVMGQGHAPCGVFDADPSYPYSDGGIGVWGWDMLRDELKNPSQFKDFMGYCYPLWISDWTYTNFWDWNRQVTAGGGPRRMIHGELDAWNTVFLGPFGSIEWSSIESYSNSPRGDLRTVVLYDAEGEIVGRSTGYFRPYPDLPGGGILRFPTPFEEVASIEVVGYGRVNRPSPAD